MVINLQFPWRLHRMLDQAEDGDFKGIVSWIMEDKAFSVHDIDGFERVVMPKFFTSHKYKSFQRNLNIWGFVQIRLGYKARCGYCHPYFVRGQPNLCCLMTRSTIKTTRAAAEAQAALEAASSAATVSGTGLVPASVIVNGRDASSTPAAATKDQSTFTSQDTSQLQKQQSQSRQATVPTGRHLGQQLSVELLMSLANGGTGAMSGGNDRSAAPSPATPMHESSATAQQSQSQQNQPLHTLVPPQAQRGVYPQQQQQQEEQQQQEAQQQPLTVGLPPTVPLAFPQSLHRVLALEEEHPFISWMPNGRSFRIIDASKLSTDKLRACFGHDNLAQFFQSLLNYGFTFLIAGANSGSFYHELMIRGYPHLTRHMSSPEESRKYKPDFNTDPIFALSPTADAATSTSIDGTPCNPIVLGDGGILSPRKQALEQQIQILPPQPQQLLQINMQPPIVAGLPPIHMAPGQVQTQQPPIFVPLGGALMPPPGVSAIVNSTQASAQTTDSDSATNTEEQKNELSTNWQNLLPDASYKPLANTTFIPPGPFPTATLPAFQINGAETTPAPPTVAVMPDGNGNGDGNNQNQPQAAVLDFVFQFANSLVQQQNNGDPQGPDKKGS